MIIRQKFIHREDLKLNPSIKYLFGDNLMRQGLGGQAKEMRGEPNAIGIATKVAPSTGPMSYFSDDMYMEHVKTILDDMMPAIEHILNGGTLVIPTDGLGSGLSQLPARAPKVNKALNDLIDYLYNLDMRNNG
jgi:hypothetical protein